jgi:hypothetical protein
LYLCLLLAKERALQKRCECLLLWATKSHYPMKNRWSVLVKGGLFVQNNGQRGIITK